MLIDNFSLFTRLSLFCLKDWYQNKIEMESRLHCIYIYDCIMLVYLIFAKLALDSPIEVSSASNRPDNQTK